MPKYIICADNQVLNIRNKPKIIETPYFIKESHEYKYSQTLLYYPLSPTQKIDIENLDNYYYDVQPNAEKDFNGRALTIVQTNER